MQVDRVGEERVLPGAEVLGDLFWKGGDKRLIDGLGPDGVSSLSYAVGRATGRLQTGYVYHYAFVMLLGVAGLLLPVTRVAAAVCLLALMLAMFPANVYASRMSNPPKSMTTRLSLRTATEVVFLAAAISVAVGGS